MFVIKYYYFVLFGLFIYFYGSNRISGQKSKIYWIFGWLEIESSQIIDYSDKTYRFTNTFKKNGYGYPIRVHP